MTGIAHQLCSVFLTGADCEPVGVDVCAATAGRFPSSVRCVVAIHPTVEISRANIRTCRINLIRLRPRQPTAGSAALTPALTVESCAPLKQAVLPGQNDWQRIPPASTDMSAYETGHHEFRAPGQSAEATGRSALPRELSAARTSVQRRGANTPAPMASTTACCSVAPRPRLPGIHEKKRIRRLAGIPGNEQSSVLIMMMRSTPAASIDSLTVAIFAESSAERSRVVAVTPRAVSTVSVPRNALVSAARSARDSTTTKIGRAHV